MPSNNDESNVAGITPSAPITSTHQTENTAQRSPEMTTVQSGSAAPATILHSASPNPLTRERTSSDRPHTPYGPVRTDTTTALAQAQAAPAQSPPTTTLPPPQRTRAQSTAIGPSTDLSEPISKDEQMGPRLELTLLLTNGARHPFILDSQYLAKRNVDVPGGDPFNMSVYKLKELILREWRDEWEQKPSSPSYIRLISFGKLLDDKTALKDQKFNRTERNVVHMTIKPQDFIDEDDAKAAKGGFSSGRAGSESRSPGCRCVIM